MYGHTTKLQISVKEIMKILAIIWVWTGEMEIFLGKESW